MRDIIILIIVQFRTNKMVAQAKNLTTVVARSGKMTLVRVQPPVASSSSSSKLPPSFTSTCGFDHFHNCRVKMLLDLFSC